MKNHIAFKFLAILLCGACLLGAVGSGLGILVLTEMDLGGRNFTDYATQELQQESQRFAEVQLEKYASQTLGGFPAEALDFAQDGILYTYRPFPADSFNYQILDEQGTVVVDNSGADLSDPVGCRFPATGLTYRFVRDITPVVEIPEDPALTVTTDTLPQEGVAGIYGISLSYDGSGSGMQADEIIGFATHTSGGGLMVSFTAGDTAFLEDMYLPDTLIGITLYGEDGQVLYEAQCDDGVGEFSRDQNGDLRSFVGIDPTTRAATVSGYINAYAQPRTDSAILTSLSAGFPVELVGTRTVDGVEWGYLKDMGWVRLDQLTLEGAEDTSPVSPRTAADLIYQGQALEALTGYAIPDAKATQVGTCSRDVLLTVYRQTLVADTPWLYTDLGWVPGEKVTVTQTAAPETEDTDTTAVVETDTFFYDSPGVGNQATAPCPAGTSLTLILRATVNDVEWAQTEAGWVRVDCLTLHIPAPTFRQLSQATLAVTEEEVPTYTTPADDKTLSQTLAAGTTLALGRQVDVSGQTWGYLLGGGWVKVSDVTLLTTSAPTLATEPAAETEPEETIPEETIPEKSLPEGLEEEVYTQVYRDRETGEKFEISYSMAPMPDYSLVLYLERELKTYDPYYEALNLLWTHQASLGKLLGICLLLFAVLAVYLCCAAGRKPGTAEVSPGGLNLLPMDLYLIGGICAGIGLGALGVLGIEELLEHDWQVACGVGLGMGYGICLIFVGFCFACAAQFKTPGGFWWRNTLCVRVPRLCWRFWRWLWRGCMALLPRLKTGICWCFGLLTGLLSRCLGLVKRLLGWIWRGMDRFVALLPLTWQWLMAGAAMFLLMLLGFASHGPAVFLCLAGCVVIILYGARCFGILAESARRMSKGDLDIQVEDPWMLGAFQKFAQDLNALAGVAVVAAQKQLKSERMKTELITNVSHDIKTPLTSIINYVDLLQKPHTPQEESQYLEVLDRQSQRLKKLIEDLMEMSKANTGNMAVDIKPLDGEEAVNQALGEFADKLSAAQLVPVFRRPEKPVTMLADGRLTWRVLSNLLSNAVKYALPGTRLYIDLMALEGKVVLSLKNISREELNVEADELLERFVRGDSSRNTEGSGLGLNIAKSLMELQKGSLQLLVDGDLFKVTLIFPRG